MHLQASLGDPGQKDHYGDIGNPVDYQYMFHSAFKNHRCLCKV